MKRKHLLLMMLALPMAALAQYKSQVWSPDNGNGTYTNPVINADYSDPDVCVAAAECRGFRCVSPLGIVLLS